MFYDSLKDCYVVLGLIATCLHSYLSYILTLLQWSAFTAVPVAAHLSILLMNHCRYIYTVPVGKQVFMVNQDLSLFHLGCTMEKFTLGRAEMKLR